MGIKRRTIMKSFSVQVTDRQDANIYIVADIEDIGSKAEVMRR